MKAGWSWLLLVVCLAGRTDREPTPKAVARDICADRTTVASSFCHVSPTLLLMDDGSWSSAISRSRCTTPVWIQHLLRRSGGRGGAGPGFGFPGRMAAGGREAA